MNSDNFKEGIVRIPRPQSNFYMLDKRISEDSRLSWAARGLLIYLLGKPDNWKVSIEHLRGETSGATKSTGRDGVYSLLAELIEVGYIKRQQIRAVGTIIAVRYQVSEDSSHSSPLPEKPELAPLPETPYTAKPDTANPTLVSTEKAVSTEKEIRIKERRKPQKTPMPENFQISERVWNWAQERNIRKLDLHFENFVSACRARGYEYVDWDEAFMGAIRGDWAKIPKTIMGGLVL